MQVRQHAHTYAFRGRLAGRTLSRAAENVWGSGISVCSGACEHAYSKVLEGLSPLDTTSIHIHS